MSTNLVAALLRLAHHTYSFICLFKWTVCVCLPAKDLRCTVVDSRWTVVMQPFAVAAPYIFVCLFVYDMQAHSSQCRQQSLYWSAGVLCTMKTSSAGSCLVFPLI